MRSFVISEGFLPSQFIESTSSLIFNTAVIQYKSSSHLGGTMKHVSLSLRLVYYQMSVITRTKDDEAP